MSKILQSILGILGKNTNIKTKLRINKKNYLLHCTSDNTDNLINSRAKR